MIAWKPPPRYNGKEMEKTKRIRVCAFTLVELLVTIAIIGIMMTWLLSALKQSREQARWVRCLSNERQIGNMINVYTADYDGYFPVPPLGKYMATWGDIVTLYMPYLYGGNDSSTGQFGTWAITTAVPANDRPLFGYIDPESHIYRCPADDGPQPWFGGPAWDTGTTSYLYNAEPKVGFPGVFERRADEIPYPSTTILVGDWAWWATRENLPDNDFAMFTFDPRPWWHPLGFKNRKVNIYFTDGHADYTPIQLRVSTAENYRRNP